MKVPLLVSLLFLLPLVNLPAADSPSPAENALPKTLMTIRGKPLATEDFDKPLAPLTGKPIGFASGFGGWRYNPGPTTGKGGMWQVADGLFTGIESPDAHHPATASFGIQFKDAIIQCEFRLNDAPANGRLYRSIFVKATDAKDYVCALFVGPGGLNALAYDDTRIDPKTKQRDKFPAVHANAPVKLGEWHTAVLEIKGEELVATMDGKSLTLSSPLVGVDKHSVMLGVGTEASFRHFRMWEALPNPDWPKNKEALTSNPPPK
ncbi:hypothetical protein CfE428DRAFT_0963 [Chthoniobacter flavus Ellin428]|uniref:3-keto-disaccharide hydrolase domain-containing protein n=1 Tax=Chthoniobacter flavus Ellin428 TaxID=497964 RepID=B4CWC6_9BACT|nr:hypothetical protein [Chthoniobacter flavus]EDY21718.1 hypothetical protein CfE428DRAFT_0963 [Chthoniobacter flavus Ellin428]TCO95653.1 hypothetical protein EV701_101341 [Chthoniobacter flavus]